MASIIAAPVQFHDRCHLPVKIYYEDTDCVGIVYHSNYLKYFERGRELLLKFLLSSLPGERMTF